MQLSSRPTHPGLCSTVNLARVPVYGRNATLETITREDTTSSVSDYIYNIQKTIPLLLRVTWGNCCETYVPTVDPRLVALVKSVDLLQMPGPEEVPSAYGKYGIQHDEVQMEFMGPRSFHSKYKLLELQASFDFVLSGVMSRCSKFVLYRGEPRADVEAVM